MNQKTYNDTEDSANCPRFSRGGVKKLNSMMPWRNGCEARVVTQYDRNKEIVQLSEFCVTYAGISKHHATQPLAFDTHNLKVKCV
jgi:hypothetical protein